MANMVDLYVKILFVNLVTVLPEDRDGEWWKTMSSDEIWLLIYLPFPL